MKRKVTLLTAIILCFSCFLIGVSSQGIIQKIEAELRPDFNIIINNKMQTFKNVNGDIVDPILYNGTTYLPIRAIGEAFGKEVSWYEDHNLIVLRDQPKKIIESANDLPGAKIGAQAGTLGDLYLSVSDYEEHGSTIDIFSKGADAIDALKNGWVDCVILDEAPAKTFVEKNEGLKILDEPFEIEEYAIAVSKDRPKLTKSISAAISVLKDNGTIDRIIANYIDDDTKGKTPYISPEGIDRSKGKLVLATNAAFPPYEFIENEKIVGIDIDIARAICDLLGYELEISDIEFDSIIVSLMVGRADFGIAALTVTEERLKNIDFTEPYTTSTQVIIVKK